LVGQSDRSDTLPRVRRALPLLIAVVALLALPGAASATLVYGIQPSRGTASIWVAANAGSGAVKLASNYGEPTISPDGTTVAAFRQTRSGGNRLYVLPAAGGPPRSLLSNAGFATVAWSPNSSTIAAYSGHRLVTANVATGATATLATGSFPGSAPSFSPAGDQVVYAKATSSRFNAPSDIYTVPSAGGAPTRLTTDGFSLNPVWGPTQIAYSRGPRRRQDSPRLNIWLMNPDGSGQHQLTNVRVPSLLSGLAPVQWSAGGLQLLAEFGGQDTDQAYAVDPTTGTASDLGVRKMDGTSPAAISRDGTTVLAQTGGQEGPSRGQNVVSIPFAGGAPTVLVRNAGAPDWNA
jgi:Tol biopolymer transport system component